MTEEKPPEDWQFQTTVKSGNGQVMTNVRGADADEFGANLTVAKDFVPLIKELADEFKAVDSLGAQFDAQHLPQQQPAQQPAYQQPQQQPAYQPAYQQPAQQPGQMCQHGVPRKFISGTSKKTGKPYAMWVCVVEQGPTPQCAAVFV